MLRSPNPTDNGVAMMSLVEEAKQILMEKLRRNLMIHMPLAIS